MRSSCSTIVRYVIGFLSLIFGVLFILLGVVGMLLRTNKKFTVKFLKSISSFIHDKATKEESDEAAEFFMKYDSAVPVIFIVVGFTIGVLCVFGFLTSCFSCHKLLRLYAVMLMVVLVAQIVTISVLFGVPHLYTNIIIKGLDEVLILYNPNTTNGHGPVILWNFIMSGQSEYCCGIDGAQDFKNSPFAPYCPIYCCNGQDHCTISAAELYHVKGCREKIELNATSCMRRVLVILIVEIVIQASILILTYISLSYKTAEPI